MTDKKWRKIRVAESFARKLKGEVALSGKTYIEYTRKLAEDNNNTLYEHFKEKKKNEKKFTMGF